MAAFEVTPTYELTQQMDAAWERYRSETRAEAYVMTDYLELTQAVGRWPVGTRGVVVPVLAPEGTLPLEVEGTRTDPESVGEIIEAPLTSLRRVRPDDA